jgi:4-hydroxy-tetrahydrodipicolinate reductase
MTGPGTVPSLLLIGHGRMGRLVESLASEHGVQVAGVLTSADNPGGTGITAERCRGVDVAVDFSRGDAVLASARALAGHGVDLVLGTTGWHEHEADVRAIAERAGIGVVAAANCSLGANLLAAIAAGLAARLRERPEFGAWIHDLHHARKVDAPSGTAREVERAMRHAGYALPIDLASTRAGAAPGTHTVGFDGPAETLTITHTVRDRATFAHGALEAARWVAGRRGWFSMTDVLGL